MEKGTYESIWLQYCVWEFNKLSSYQLSPCSWFFTVLTATVNKSGEGGNLPEYKHLNTAPCIYEHRRAVTGDNMGAQKTVLWENPHFQWEAFSLMAELFELNVKQRSLNAECIMRHVLQKGINTADAFFIFTACKIHTRGSLQWDPASTFTHVNNVSDLYN